ncbi:MAG TPA: translocation/assembly module TamB domain-containing protein [Thermohalobaculum sp.]|nr:translocation/assembly module TamB domain-containing protein [Thermohalobaculum sp.]
MRNLQALLALAALLAGLAVPQVEAFIRLPSIQNRLIELALDQISSPGSFEVIAESVEDSEDGATSLLGVQVSDGEGVWLSLERLTFEWRPTRLAAGELAITRLELIGLDVTRPPSEDAEPPKLKPQEPWQRGPFDWPRAPISVVVEGVRIERASIAEGVLPQAIRFDAEGRAFDKGDLQEVELSLARTDAVEGRFALLMRRDFSAGTLRLDITASEAPGGIVAAAAGFPDDAPARLELKADGTVEDWRLDFDAAVERVFEAGGNATLSYDERLSVNADFTVTPGPELQPELRTVLGDQARLRAEIIEQADGMIEVVTGELTSPALRMSASGALATGPGESDLAVSLEALAPLGDLVEDVAFEHFTFEGRVRGPQGALVARGALGLDGLATALADAGSLALDGEVAQTAEGFDFELAGSGEALRLDRLGPELIGPARLEAAGVLSGEVLTLDRAVIGATAFSAEAAGRYDLATSAGNLTLSFAAPDIAPLAAAYEVTAEGGVTADAEVALAAERIEADLSAALEGFAMDRVAAARLGLSGRVTQAGERLTFDIEGNGDELRLDEIPPDLTREARLAARGAMEGGRLDLAAVRLASRLLTAEVSGTVELEDGTLALDYRLETPELAPVAAAYGADAAGALAATGRMAGPFATPRIAGEASLSGAAFAGRSYGTASLEHDVTLDPVPEGSLALRLDESWLGDAQLETEFRLDGRLLSLAQLEAQVFGAGMDGALEIDLDSMLAEGAVAVSVADLGPLGGVAGTALTGSMAGDVTLTPDAGEQGLAANLTGRSLASGDVTVATAALELTAADLLGSPRLDVAARAEGIATGAVRIETAAATARGGLAALEFDGEASGSFGEEPLDASFAGRADASGVPMVVTLARGAVGIGPDRIELERPLEFRLGGGLVEATGLSLALPGDATLRGDAALRPGGFTGDLTLERLPLEAVGRLAGVPLTGGQLDARAVFDTRPGPAGAELSAQARGVTFEQAEAIGRSLDIDLDADWDGARLEARSELRGGFGEPFRAQLAVPLQPRSAGLPAVPPQGVLEGRLAWAGRIGDLWALVPAPGHLLDGDADIDLALGGTLDAPRVSGRAKVSGGQYQNLDAGTILTDLTLTTRIAEDRAVGVTLEVRDGAKGRVTAQGDIRFGDGPPALDLTANAERAVLVRRDDVAASLSGEVALVGPVNQLVLTGRLTVNEAEVRLVNATPPEVVDLEGIRLVGSPEPEPDGDGRGVMRLDLTVEAPGDIFVRGRGLDSEWRMALNVSGDSAAPVVAGTIERVRGQLQLLGRAFMLERGRVTFDGERPIDPVLDVYLQREDHGIRGGIVVAGRASEPELGFTSSPALPEDEVMPRLLFGQSRQSLTGGQALQLAAGLATLMGGDAGPIDALRELAGLDVLRFEGESVDEAAVTVGRNVAEGVFIGARQGLGGQGSAVTVEVEVFSGVTIDTEIKQDGGSNIGITLRKDF